MTFISYAQNFEDVMLWRALKNIQNGFYIDIGAQDPFIDSVSLAFYEHGWQGVHVEPTKQYSDKLRAARPDDFVEQVAIGNLHQNIKFFEFADTGLSTADSVIAKKHQESGFSVLETEVSVVSLDYIFDKYGDREINWLKIDVEGFEGSVLESWNNSSCRPWILIIESTKPLTQDESYADWEKIVLEKGYEFTYFDGLNRFYVHQAHQELTTFFKTAPNIFDGFELSGLASQPFCRFINKKLSVALEESMQAEARAEQASIYAERAEIKAQQAYEMQKVAELAAEKALLGEKEAIIGRSRAQAESEEAINQLAAVHNSLSWRVTKPLRSLRRLIKNVDARKS